MITLRTALAPMIWGTTYAVTILFLPPSTPFLDGAVRALPAGLLLLAIARTLPRGAWWWKSAVLGVLNIGAFFALLFASAYLLPGGIAAIFGALGPLLVALIARVVLHVAPARGTVRLGLVSIAGVAMIVSASSFQLNAWGIAAGLASVTSMGAGTVLAKKWDTRTQPQLALAAWQLSWGGLFLLPLALLMDFPVELTATNWWGFAVVAVVHGALSYYLWITGVSLLDTNTVSFLPLLSPIVAAGAGWAIFNQSLTAWQLVGMAITLAATVLATIHAGGARNKGRTRHRGRALSSGLRPHPPTIAGEITARTPTRSP